MDEGVAYMVMDEGAEATQPTQVVAIDNGDGTQQFAIPVIDPETGQETYMIIDPETAENINNGGTVVVNSEPVPDQVQAQGEAGYAVIENNEENMLGKISWRTGRKAGNLLCVFSYEGRRQHWQHHGHVAQWRTGRHGLPR